MTRTLKLFITGLILFAGLFLLTYLTLDAGQELVTADVIIVPEGQPERSKKAVELLKEGKATSDKIIVSPIYDGSSNLLDVYKRLGAIENNLVSETSATSTWTNATNTIKIMENNGWKSAIVVTSDYHIRRTKLSFNRASRGKDLDFTFVSAYPSKAGKPVHYIDSNHNRTQAAIEVFKYWGYLLGLYSMIDL